MGGHRAGNQARTSSHAASGTRLILVNLRTNKISSLNRTGARCWELLEARRDWDETRESLLAEFDVEPGELDRELEALVGSLTAGGFLKSTTRSTPGRADAGVPAPSGGGAAQAPRARRVEAPHRS